MQVTRAQLLQDLDTLPQGDLTLVGTQGVQLSGGQRARGAQITRFTRITGTKVQILMLGRPARARYSNNLLYLFYWHKSTNTDARKAGASRVGVRSLCRRWRLLTYSDVRMLTYANVC